MKGAAKLQYNDFLRALMLIADKHHAGFREVVGRIQRYGIHRRDPSMADFLVLRDPGGTYEDARDLERPPGLPQLLRPPAASVKYTDRSGLGAETALSAYVSPRDARGLSNFPSAAAGLQDAGVTGGCHAQPAARQHGWDAAAAEPLAIGGTGTVQGGSLHSTMQGTAGCESESTEALPIARCARTQQWPVC